jgi:probable F420-dependent oxidoreductase
MSPDKWSPAPNDVNETVVGFGVYLPQYGSAIKPGTFASIARETEDMGFDSLWLGEHLGLPIKVKMDTWGYGQYPVQNTRPWLETMTGLAYLAAVTRRARLGTAVLAAPWRHPFITAKMLSSIDNLSNGRLIVGVGTGNFTEEFAALGIPYEQRGPLTDEAIEAWQVLFTQDEPEFHGPTWDFENLSFWPKPVQRPSPPIWVGSGRLTTPVRRRIARFASGWLPSLYTASPTVIKDGIAMLQDEVGDSGEHNAFDVCLWAPTRVGDGRPRDWSVWNDNLICGTPDEVQQSYADYIRAGCTHFVICVGGPPPERMRQLEVFQDKVIPALRSEFG